MKKLLVLLFLFSIFSVFAVDNETLKENDENSQQTAELKKEDEYAKRKLALSEARRKKREAETEKFDEALDIKYHTENYYVLSGKFLKIEFFGKTGTFNIFCISDGKEIPLLSTADLSSSTEFFLKVDGIIQPLGEKRVRKELRRLDNGAQLLFRLENRLRLVIDFSLIKTRSEYPEDIVKIQLFTLNEGKNTHNVEIRSIFDTICGETSAVHFTTENRTKIRNESRFSKLDIRRERAINLSNGLVSFQFVLEGIDITPVETVIFGNIDELHRMDWDSGFRKGRGFSNIRGYDDSGIMIAWPEFTIPVNGKNEIMFYIAAADNEEYPRGLLYADKILYPKVEEVKEEAKKQGENQEKRTDVEFVVPQIKDYQLDPEYIQQLIDKIDALQSSKDVNKKELMRLNMELDAILEKLRR